MACSVFVLNKLAQCSNKDLFVFVFEWIQEEEPHKHKQLEKVDLKLSGRIHVLLCELICLCKIILEASSISRSD